MPRKKPLSIPARVQSGKIQAAPTKLRSYWKLVSEVFEGRPIEITVRDRGAKRSNNQNAYLWGAVYPSITGFFMSLGEVFSLEDTHEWCKTKFNQKPLFDPEADEYILVGGSTAAMNKEEFGEYIDKIRSYFQSTFHHYIPTPEDYYETI